MPPSTAGPFPSHCLLLLLALLSLLPLFTHSYLNPSFNPPPATALIIVDVQNCFSPSGSLPVPSFSTILPIINRLHLLPFFTHVIVTLDWHPPGHISFASTQNLPPFSTLSLSYSPTGQLCSPSTPHTQPCPRSTPLTAVNQTLWPDHCIANTSSAALHPHLLTLPSDILIHKGTSPHIDSYSAFHDAVASSSTPLPALLDQLGVEEVYVVGVAEDVCVMATALDGVKEGKRVWVVEEGTVGIGDGVKERERMERAGVQFIHAWDVEGFLAAEHADSVAMD